MSIEKSLLALTAAVEANTAALLGGKKTSKVSQVEEDEDDDDLAPAKPTRAKRGSKKAATIDEDEDEDDVPAPRKSKKSKPAVEEDEDEAEDEEEDEDEITHSSVKKLAKQVIDDAKNPTEMRGKVKALITKLGGESIADLKPIALGKLHAKLSGM